MLIYKLIIFAILAPYIALTASAAPRTSSATTLIVTPSQSVAAHQIVTVTATISVAGAPVTGGTASFYDGKLYLGSVQIVRNAVHGYAIGTATLKMTFSLGSHTVFAVFAGTAAIAPSTSASQTFTVTGTDFTSAVLAATAGTDDYILNQALTAYGVSKPSGSVFFVDQTTNTALGTVTVNPSNFTRGFSFSQQNPKSTFGDLNVNTADLNGDGIPDLLVQSNPDARLDTLYSVLGNGDGTFQDGIDIVSPYEGNTTVEGTAVMIGDFNGDGVPDFAFVTVSPLSVGLGNGDGTFQNTVNYSVDATGGGPFGQNPDLQFITSGDFNGDGILDLIATDATSNTFFILFGNADGTFGTPLATPSPASVTSLLAEDFSLDGYADLAVTLSGQNAVFILLGNGDGTFQPPTSYPTGNSPLIGGALQARGNVGPDLAILNKSDNTLGILLGNGDGTFLPQATYPVSLQAVQVVAADLTGDGLQDIAVLNGNTYTTSPAGPGSITIFPGNGDGTYQTSFQHGGGFTPQALVSADFNGDGVSDLVAADYGDFDLGVFLSDEQGNVSLTTPVIANGSQQLASQYLGDASYNTSVSNSIIVQGDAGPSFTASLSANAITIASGQTGTVTLTLTPQNGFDQAVQFSCSGLPANTTCSFSPMTVTPDGAPAFTTLTIRSGVKAGALALAVDPLSGRLLPAAFLLGFGGFYGSVVLRNRYKRLPLPAQLSLFWAPLLLVGIALIGCGGSAPRTSTGTSSVMVTASAMGQTGGPSATLILTVVVTD